MLAATASLIAQPKKPERTARIKDPHTGEIVAFPIDGVAPTIDEMNAAMSFFDDRAKSAKPAQSKRPSVAPGRQEVPPVATAIARLGQTTKDAKDAETLAWVKKNRPDWLDAQGRMKEFDAQGNVISPEANAARLKDIREGGPVGRMRTAAAKKLETVNAAVASAVGPTASYVAKGIAGAGGPTAATAFQMGEDPQAAGRAVTSLVSPLEWAQQTLEGDPLAFLALVGLKGSVGPTWRKLSNAKTAVSKLIGKGLSPAQASRAIDQAVERASFTPKEAPQYPAGETPNLQAGLKTAPKTKRPPAEGQTAPVGAASRVESVPPKPPVSPTKGTVKGEGAEPTAIALSESEKRGLLPDTPDVRHDVDLAKQAEQSGLGTPEGAAGLLEKAKTTELADHEYFGLGVRLANIDTELMTATGPAREALMTEAKAIRGIRGTETARALRARGILAATDYTPQGFVRAVEVAREGTGRAPLKPSERLHLENLGKQAEKWKAEAEKYQAQLEELRKNPPKASPRTKRTPQMARDEAVKELWDIVGRASAGVDPTIVRPIAKIVKSFIDEQLPLREALEKARIEIKSAIGQDFAPNDLHDAYLGFSSPEVAKRSLTEYAIWARRRARQVRSEMQQELGAAATGKASTAADRLARISVEARLWNPVARAIDQGANAQEAIMSASTSFIDRPIANTMAKVLKSDARWKQTNLSQKSEMLGRFVADVKDAWHEAKSGYDGTGPATHLAGELDAPARAWAQLSYAGERAAALSAKLKAPFGDILDQIRDPYVGGPLDFNQARKLHGEMKDWADITMLTNSNVVSRGRQWVKMGIKNSTGIPDPIKPAANFAVDIMTTFGKVLVNVSDKTAQYSNPYYSIARGVYELLPRNAVKGIPRDVRIRQFAAIARRGGIGVALTSLGYQIYKDPSQRDGLIGGALNLLGTSKLELPAIIGPILVQGRNQKGGKTGNVWQDEGYIAQFGGVLAAVLSGYRSAQIDEAESNNTITANQADKLRRSLKFAPLTDNPVATNLKRGYQALMSGEREVGDTLSDWVIGLYYPGGLREWSRLQQAQEGVYGRRAKGMFEDDASDFWDRAGKMRDSIWEQFKKRTPYLQSDLPARAVAK